MDIYLITKTTTRLYTRLYIYLYIHILYQYIGKHQKLLIDYLFFLRTFFLLKNIYINKDHKYIFLNRLDARSNHLWQL